jgi:Mg2+/Co2+ transporter CorB
MTPHDWVTLFVVLVFLFLAFLFSGSETALTASSRAPRCGCQDRECDAVTVTPPLENW